MNLNPIVADWLRRHNAQFPTGAAGNADPSAIPGALGNPGGTDTGGAWIEGPAQNPGDYYKGLINSDPLYKQALADLSAQGVQNAQQRAQAIQQFLIQYGEVPGDLNSLGLSKDALGYLGQDVNATTRDLAAKNTQAGLSIVARLLAQHKTATQNIQDTLAARGIFRSGATPVAVGQEGQQYKQAGYDARTSLLGGIQGTIGSFMSAEQARQTALRQALNDAYQRALASNPDPPGPTRVHVTPTPWNYGGQTPANWWHQGGV